MFKQKAVIGTLLVPMFMMMAFGILPTLVGIDKPFQLTYFNEDDGIGEVNLGNNITNEISAFFLQNEGLELKIVNNLDDFNAAEDAIWIPSNFTAIANSTHIAQYFQKVSDSNLRSEPIINGVVRTIIETVVTEELLKPIVIPQIIAKQIIDKEDVLADGDTKDRGRLAFPLAYMSFLILVLSGSAIRITGFNAEKTAHMMELLLSTVKKRRELVLSKLITGVTYGLASVTSYLVGVIIAAAISNSSSNSPEDFNALLFPSNAITIKNIIIFFMLFIILIFTSTQIMLTSQLLLGKEAGDRFGATANMAIAFIFYFSLIGDPLEATIVQIVNPFYWGFRIALNLIFNENYLQSLGYAITNIIFSSILLKIKTIAIEKEKVIFD